LQPPFFAEHFDAAVNYGAIGCVIAHEFTHAFDDQGSQYDADGNLNNWWSEEDWKQFEEKQKLIIAQYDAYTILDTLHLNGALTVGENIADLGGVSVAFEAFQIYRQKHGRQQSVDGFTPEQRFFIAWTQVWRQNKTAEALRLQVNTSTTSPYSIRGFAPLSNLQGFIDAFNLGEGDRMVLPKNKRFVIW
jgi:predicted metalloendopeptidase